MVRRREYILFAKATGPMFPDMQGCFVLLPVLTAQQGKTGSIGPVVFIIEALPANILMLF